VGTLEIGPGPWQTLGQLLDQLPSTKDGARYLARMDASGSGKTLAELIEAGEIQNVIEQLAQHLDHTSRR
ncbi:MAG: hypothetical protein AAFW74_10535, partial [Pseudomonadota bacterium]